MDRHPRMVLGKRRWHAGLFDQTPIDSIETPPKRTRARRNSSTHECNPRSGLLTPEPSIISTESQVSSKQTASNTTSIFPFMSLPAELRLHIYHMALVRPYPLSLHAALKVPEQPDTDTDTTQPPPPPPPPPPITQPLLQHVPRAPQQQHQQQRPSSPPPDPTDPIVPEILRLNKQIYKEARQLLYSENVFRLTLASGIHTLSTLHQRSRSLVKHVVLTIPSHHDILDGFADLVRLGLRYCWGLKSFRIILHASLPDDGRVSGATSVYANAFHILRWLPRGCSVMLEGCVSETVRKVVLEEGRLMNVLDETSYLKRQHQMPERH